MTWRNFLGLVLKDSMDGIPMVYAILISIDREDVSNVSAFQKSSSEAISIFIQPQGTASLEQTDNGLCDSFKH
jgi:hypothetical protein